MISSAPICRNSGARLARTRAAALRIAARRSSRTFVATGVMTIRLPSRVNATSLPGATPATTGPQALWGVADATAAYTRLLALGATALEPVNDVGGGIKVAAVRDPFGNRLGLIENPHFDVKAVR